MSIKSNTITIQSTERLKTVSSKQIEKASARTDAMETIKELYAFMQAKEISTFGDMPQTEMQNDFQSFKRACNACLKVGEGKGATLARKAYGYLIVSGSITPF